jgi:RNA-binding protein YhbY
MTATQTAAPTQTPEALLRDVAFALKMAQLVKVKMLAEMQVRAVAVKAARRPKRQLAVAG